MDVKLEPLRSLDDFLMKSARFQVPDVTDLDRWAKRVKENLIYYQTNYFLTITIMFLIVSVMHPVQMLLGVAANMATYLLFGFIVKNQTTVSDFKKNHPTIFILGCLVGGYFVMSLIASVLVFFCGVLVPITAIFLHSSLRLRDAKNKFSNLKEKLQLKTTPMGILLEEIGMPFDGFTD